MSNNYKNNVGSSLVNIFWGIMWACSLTIFTFTFSFLYGALSYGCAVMYFWEWFVVPVFHLTPLSLLQSAGIMYMCQLLTFKESPLVHVDEENKPTIKENCFYYVALFMMPWIFLVTGYLLHRLILY